MLRFARMFAYSDYQTYLQGVFFQKRKQNKSYSLRAFARDLKISPSRLTEIFSRKNGLSSSNASKISEILKHDAEEAEWFHASVESQHSRSELQRKQAIDRFLKFQTRKTKMIRADEFRLISEWYHLSILELLNIKDSELNPQWISAQLGITVAEAANAIERLIRLGWIHEEGKKWISRKEYRSMTAPVAIKTIQKYQKQLIQKAEKAIQTQSPDIRTMQSLVLALPKKNYTKAIEELEAFCQDFNLKFGAKSGNGDHVYALTMQFFQISKSLNGENKE
jgi:uncharacterized protein (TIGR02147 family)